MNDANRRRNPRYPHRVRVQVMTAAGTLEGWTDNVSQDGLFFQCPRPLPLGQAVALRLHLLDGTLLDVTAVVARVVAPSMSGGEGVGVGAQFASITEAARAHWLRYLQPLAPSPSSVNIPVARPVVPTPAPAPVPPPMPAAARTTSATGLPAVSTLPADASAMAGSLVVEVRPSQAHTLLDQFTLDMAGGTLRVRGLPQLPVGMPLTVKVIHPDGGTAVELPGKVQSGVANSLVVGVLVPPTHRSALQAFLQPLQ